MPIIKSINGKSPSIPDSCWIADNATITGSVRMGEDCSLWYNAVIRGDVNHINIGRGVNIQDGAIVHGSTNGPDTVIGDYTSIGHGAIVHGCVIQKNTLIGMGSIILDNAIIESHALVAAGAVVTVGTRVQSGWIYAGTPARKIKELSTTAIERMIYETAKGYIALKNDQ